MRTLQFAAMTVCLSFASTIVVAQKTNQQLWMDYLLDVPFKNKYLFETELSYQTLLSQQDKWRSYNVTPAFEYNVLPYLDLISSVPMSYTVQTSTFNSLEVREMLGARLYFTPGKRIETRATLRYEHRSFKDVEGSDWESSNRFRIRGELVVPINRSNYYQDKMWYGLLDAEAFIVVDQNVSERFANRTRVRLGLGYRLSYSFRFEAIYTAQSSRDELDQQLVTSDQIFRFRIKHYLNKAKPAKSESGGGT